MIQFNEEAFNGFNQNALVPCRYCNRTFLPDSLKIHRKICTADKPFKPLKRGQKPKQRANPKPAKHSWEDQPIGGRKGNRDWEEEEEPVRKKQPQRRNPNLYKKKPVKKKMKNFYEDSDDDSEIMNNYSYSRPKKGAHLKKTGPTKNFNTQRKQPTKKPSKYGTEPQRRRERPKNTRQAYNGGYGYDYDEPEPEPVQQRAPKPKKRTRPKPKPKAQPEITYDFSGPPANLEKCRFCGRSFAEDRIKKHMTVCRIQSKKKTKVKRFHKVMTNKEKRKIQKQKPKSDWKTKHQEFVKQMRYMRKLKKVEEEGGDIRSIAPPPPSVQPGLVPCKYCGRRFREQAHGRHEKICQTVFGGKKGPTRPKKTRQQRRRGY